MELTKLYPTLKLEESVDSAMKELSDYGYLTFQGNSENRKKAINYFYSTMKNRIASGVPVSGLVWIDHRNCDKIKTSNYTDFVVDIDEGVDTVILEEVKKAVTEVFVKNGLLINPREPESANRVCFTKRY